MELSLVVDGQAVSLLGVAALGIGVGLIAGMFGVGGGFLLIPLLHVVLGVPLPWAVGAGLCQTIAIGTGAYLRFRQMGHAETRFDVMLLGGSLLGVDAGARLLTLLDDLGTVTVAGKSVPTLQVVMTSGYGLLFAGIALLLWFKPSPSVDGPAGPGPLARLRLPPRTSLPAARLAAVSGPLVGLLGFANGVLAGLLGIGGGILLIPLMIYGFGFDIVKAAGTGIIVVLATAVVGTVQHARLGHVHLGLAATLMIGSAVAAQIGASLTGTLPPWLTRRALAFVMVATVASLAYKVFLA